MSQRTLHSITFVQINIERSKHLDLVIPFLQDLSPDVVCMQELMEKDIPHFEAALGMKIVYEPSCFHPAENNTAGVMGVGIFSRHGFVNTRAPYYYGQRDPLVVHTPGVPGTTSNAFLVSDISVEGVIFRIGNTHFTWAAGGGTNDLQREHVKKLLPLIKEEGEQVFSGDFNAPRGGEIFSALAAEYTDNIPADITSSIDGSLHVAGSLPYMVDGVFSTPGYSVSDVKLVSGVSDHCAVTATIQKL